MISPMFSSTSRHMPSASIVVMFAPERAAQTRERARHAFARRRLVDARGRGHLLEAEIRQEPEEQRVAIARSHPLEQRPRPLGPSLLAQGLVHARRRRQPRRLELGVAPPSLLEQLQTL